MLVCVFYATKEYHTPPSPPTPGKEQEGGPARRGSDGKLRGRKRANDPAPPLDSEIEVHTLLCGLSYTSQAIMMYLTNKQAPNGFHHKKQSSIVVFCILCSAQERPVALLYIFSVYKTRWKMLFCRNHMVSPQRRFAFFLLFNVVFVCVPAESVYLGPGWNHHHFPLTSHRLFFHTLRQGTNLFYYFSSD